MYAQQDNSYCAMGIDFEVLRLLMLASKVINMMKVVFGPHQVKASKDLAAIDCKGVEVNFEHFFDIDDELEVVGIWLSRGEKNYIFGFEYEDIYSSPPHLDKLPRPRIDDLKLELPHIELDGFW